MNIKTAIIQDILGSPFKQANSNIEDDYLTSLAQKAETISVKTGLDGWRCDTSGKNVPVRKEILNNRKKEVNLDCREKLKEKKEIKEVKELKQRKEVKELFNLLVKTVLKIRV